MNEQVKNVIDKIDTLRVDGNTPYWNISFATGMYLHDLVITHKPKRILEIGTSIGYSGLFLGDALSTYNGHLYTIESHKDRFAIAKDHFTQAGLTPYITQISGHAPEVLTEITPFINMAFFDATKAEHISYINALEPLLHKEALVITDNVLSHKEDMKPFVDYMMNHTQFTSTIEDIGTGLLISKKVA